MGNWIEIGKSGTRAYLAQPDGGSGPGVLVLHAWWGLTPVFTGICDHLAEAGYVALAPDLYPNQATATTIPEAEALVSAHDAAPGIAEAALQASVDALRDSAAVTGNRFAVIGFSMGAWWALRLSQKLQDVGAVVTYYGAGDGDFGTARAAYLGHFAEHDDFEPLEGVRELEASIRAAGREVTFHIYPGTGHWFAEPNQPNAYDAEAADLAWERTLAFLESHLA